MEPALTIYIDEAGDPGIRDGVSYADGRHEWLCISAVVIKSPDEPAVVDWVKDLRETANARQGNVLHYHKITRARRSAVCERLAKKPVRAFCMASHKSNMREHVNPRLGKMPKGDQFYNWCFRIMLERLTHWCAEWQTKNVGKHEALRVVFAERGGHDYGRLMAYVDKLKWQAETDTLFLKSMGLDPPLLKRESWSVEPTVARAGLQLADTVASAFYQAANTASPAWDLEPAKRLRPIIATNKRKRRADYGLTVWPLRHQSDVPAASRPIFDFYGYNFE